MKTTDSPYLPSGALKLSALSAAGEVYEIRAIAGHHHPDYPFDLYRDGALLKTCVSVAEIESRGLGHLLPCNVSPLGIAEAVASAPVWEEIADGAEIPEQFRRSLALLVGEASARVRAWAGLPRQK